jgi:topoisomerase-4 subunit A
LTKLIRREITEDAEQYGDERRTRIVERAAAQAIEETELVANEPVTVVLSTGGFVRAAKGHEIDPLSLTYKTGDAFQSAVRGRSTQPALFVDSTGRAYSVPAHSLPSARGAGEPLSGRLDPPDGARFAGVLIGEPEDLWLLATDAGYGFTVRLKELGSRNRAGKAVINVGEGAQVLPPVPVPAGDALVAAVHSEGRLLVFPASDVPELARGKGNKLFGIPGKKAEDRSELMCAVTVLAPGTALKLWSGERHMTISANDLKDYRGERAQRGAVLPRGWRKIARSAPPCPPPATARPRRRSGRQRHLQCAGGGGRLVLHLLRRRHRLLEVAGGERGIGLAP